MGLFCSRADLHVFLGGRERCAAGPCLRVPAHDKIGEGPCRQGCILLSVSNLAKETAYSSHQIRGELRALPPDSSPIPHVRVRKEKLYVFLECQPMARVWHIQPRPWYIAGILSQACLMGNSSMCRHPSLSLNFCELMASIASYAPHSPHLHYFEANSRHHEFLSINSSVGISEREGLFRENKTKNPHVATIPLSHLKK